jgi:predicted RNase H-like nuclease (RuvC/YqgF family)
VLEKESQREQEKTMYRIHIERLEKANKELTYKIYEQKRTIENIPPEFETKGE